MSCMKVLGLAAIAVLPVSAMGMPITFDAGLTPFSGAGQSFVTQDFRFDLGADNTANIATGAAWCSPECAENGTKYLLNLDSGRFAAVTMSSVDGSPFSLLGFDAAEAFEGLQSSAAYITVVGFRSNGTSFSTIASTFALDGMNDGSGSGIDFQKFFTPLFTDVLAVTFNGIGGPIFGQDNNFYQFFSLDNIEVNVTSVPEPGTILLLSGGLLGLAASRRRSAQR